MTAWASQHRTSRPTACVLALSAAAIAACHLDYSVQAEQRTVAMVSSDWPSEVSLGDTISLNVTMWTTGGDTTARLQIRNAKGETLTGLVTFRPLTWTVSGPGFLRRIQDTMPLPNAARFVAERAGAVFVTVSIADDPAVHGRAMTDTVRVAHGWSTTPGALTAGVNRTCAVDVLHEVYCWGAAFPGGAGAGLATNVPTRLFPVSTLNALTVTLGDAHACALGLSMPGDRVSFLPTGPLPSIYCWGDSRRGQVGAGTTTSSATPVFSVDASDGLSNIVTGSAHSCAIMSGTVHCWGDNNAGQLGMGDTPTPCPTASGGSCLTYQLFFLSPANFSALAAGGQYTCGVTQAAQLYCWGSSATGALGLGTQVRSVGVATLVPSPEPLNGVTAGTAHACAMSNGGAALCWGSDVYHETGVAGGRATCGATTCVPAPSVVQGGLRFFAISAGDGFTCAIATLARVYCWGRNDLGQLGTAAAITDRCGDVPCSAVPRPIAIDAEFVSVSAGSGHACAITLRRQLYCWGRNNFGQVGDGSTTTVSTPVRVGQ